MPRINPINAATADAETAAALGAVKFKLGMVPNLISTLANSSVALNTYLQVSDVLATGRLNAGQREIVALAVAQSNECHYCLSAHSLLGKNAGLSDSDVVNARRGVAVDVLDDAIAGYARQIVDKRAVLSDAELEAYRATGLDDGLMLEIVTNVVHNTLTNYVNHIADTEIDFPVVNLKAA